MIKLKNEDGEFEFSDVGDLIKFLNHPDAVDDFDMKQFGYLVSNLTSHHRLSIFCSKGLKALVELRVRGMNDMVAELKET